MWRVPSSPHHSLQLISPETPVYAFVQLRGSHQKDGAFRQIDTERAARILDQTGEGVEVMTALLYVQIGIEQSCRPFGESVHTQVGEELTTKCLFDPLPLRIASSSPLAKQGR